MVIGRLEVAMTGAGLEMTGTSSPGSTGKWS